MLTAVDLPGFPSDLAAEFDHNQSQIDQMQNKVDALNACIRLMREENRASLDLYAENLDDHATLMALVGRSDVAYRKVSADLRTIHPRLYDYEKPLVTDWLNTDEQGNPREKPIQLISARVSLMTRNRRPATMDDANDIAAALIEFARRYNPTPVGLLPEWGMGDHTGMVQACFTTENADSPVIWYTPDGTDAAYYPDTSNGFTGYIDAATGTLADMLCRAIRDANSRDLEADDMYP